MPGVFLSRRERNCVKKSVPEDIFQEEFSCSQSFALSLHDLREIVYPTCRSCSSTVKHKKSSVKIYCTRVRRQ